MAKKKYYEMWPDEGCHPCPDKEHDNEFIGVQLDDETNRPHGAVHFKEADTNEFGPDDLTNVAVAVIAVLELVDKAVKYGPRIINWCKETAFPGIKGVFKKKDVQSVVSESDEAEIIDFQAYCESLKVDDQRSENEDGCAADSSKTANCNE